MDNKKENAPATRTMVIVIAAIVIVFSGVVYSLNGGWNDAMTEEGMSIQEGVGMMEEKSMEDEGDAMMEKEAGAMTDDAMIQEAMPEKVLYEGAVLAGTSDQLLDFKKADYDKALTSDNLVVLYFYADWCPVCRAETENSLYPAFNEIDSGKIVGFRVNYNDKDTDSDEKELAREFGVAYQHTKVFVRNGQRILKSPEEWNKDRYLSEMRNAL